MKPKIVTQAQADKTALAALAEFISPWPGLSRSALRKRLEQAQAQAKHLPERLALQALRMLAAPQAQLTRFDAEAGEALAKLREAKPGTVGELRRFLEHYTDETPLRVLPEGIAVAALAASALLPPVRKIPAKGEKKWSGEPFLSELGL